MNEHEQGRTSGTDERAPHDVQQPVQLIHLNRVAAQVRAERERHGADHSAYTLRNAVALRQVLIVLRPDGRLKEHHADGGVAIQVLDGEVAATVGGTEYVLGPGDLLDLAPGIRHDLRGRSESTVLLTIAPVGTVAHPGMPQP